MPEVGTKSVPNDPLGGITVGGALFVVGGIKGSRGGSRGGRSLSEIVPQPSLEEVGGNEPLEYRARFL